MKLIYDITFITPDNFYKGIPVHSLRIIDAIPFEKRKDITLLVNGRLKEYAKEHFHGYNLKITPVFPGIFQKIFIHFFYPSYYRRAINNSNCDAFIVANEYSRLPLQRFVIPKVIFSHDLKGTKRCYNKTEEKMNLRYTLYKQSLESASLVLAISEYTKNDIREIYPNIDQSKIKIVYNSVVLSSESKKPNGIDKAEKFILTVNHLDKYKNALTTIKAFAEISTSFRGSLVIVSRPTPYWEEECVPFIESKGLINRIKLLSSLSNEELKWLYENALLFVSSSTHEGFGFTPIEAAICKCPVICTDAEALPETTMNRVCYYSPAEDYLLLANKINKFLINPPSNKDLEETALIFKERYSPQKQVERMFELIDEMLRN